MREIPEDIRATVEDLFEDSLMRPFRNDEAKRLVARAILAERERSSSRRANARLIAAAPELLEALKGLLSDIEEYQEINKLGGKDNHWQVISRAAIAKAEARP